MEHNIKVALIGEGRVGKTTFLTRLRDQRFEGKYIATLGAEVCVLEFSSNYGTISFDVWDTAGEEKFKGMGDGYYIGSQACIAMFDCSSDFALRNLENRINGYTRVVKTPIAICRAKTDVQAPNYPSAEMNKLRGKLQEANTFCEISSKNGVNCSDPFLWIARQITGHLDLVFN